jgi:hypothetical protein
MTLPNDKVKRLGTKNKILATYAVGGVTFDKAVGKHKTLNNILGHVFILIRLDSERMAGSTLPSV